MPATNEEKQTVVLHPNKQVAMYYCGHCIGTVEILVDDRADIFVVFNQPVPITGSTLDGIEHTVFVKTVVADVKPLLSRRE